MSLMSRIKTAVGLQKSALASPSSIPASWPSNFFQRGYQQPRNGTGSVVESCVAAYAQTIAQMPGRHYKLDADGTKTYVTNSRLARILAQPNEFQTRSDFQLNLVYSLLLNGNAYWVGNVHGSEKPGSIYLLDSNSTTAHRVRETGDIFYGSSGAFLEVADAQIDGRAMIPERFVGHLRLHTPTDPLVGVTPLANAASSVTAHQAIVNQQAAFFTNSSRPSGVLSTELDLTAEQMGQLRDAWNSHSAQLNSGGIPILGGGMKFSPMSMSSQDAQMVEAWKMTVEEISRVFRIPPMLINNLENATFQNSEALMRFWLASGLGFLINHVELSYAKYYGLDPRKEGVELDQEVLLRSDLKGQLEALGIGVTKGILSPNEARKKIGLGPAEGADSPMVQQQMVPISLAASPYRPDLAPITEVEPDKSYSSLSRERKMAIAAGLGKIATSQGHVA